jgi:hypothetical protein
MLRAPRLDPLAETLHVNAPRPSHDHFPLRLFELALFFAAGIGRFAAEAGLRPLAAGIGRFACEEVAVDRRAAERGVVERRPYSRSGSIAMSSSILLAFCFVFFPTPVPRTIAVLLFSSSRAIDRVLRLARCPSM